MMTLVALRSTLPVLTPSCYILRTRNRKECTIKSTPIKVEMTPLYMDIDYKVSNNKDKD